MPHLVGLASKKKIRETENISFILAVAFGIPCFLAHGLICHNSASFLRISGLGSKVDRGASLFVLVLFV